jgi:hypothetical protein
MNLRPLQFAIIGLASILSSCSDSEVRNYGIAHISVAVDGPLYDGPSTLQAVHPLNLADIDAALQAENIESVKLVKATIETEDSAGFDRIRNFVLQFTSAESKMQKAAVLNPVPKGSRSVDLSISSDADLKDIFRHSEMIVILDADVEGDWEEGLNYNCRFDFAVTYKK